METLTIQSAIFQAPPEPGQVDARELLWTYLNRVVIDTGTLDLSGVDRRMLSDQQDTRLELAAVYTSLDTVRSVRERAGRHGMESPARKEVGDPEWPSESLTEKRQSALAFTAEQPYAALLGDPGGGKTTFANFLALCLAGELLGLDNANLERLGEEWTKEKPGALLPVRVVLRNLAVQLDKLPADETLWTYITQRLGNSLEGFAPLLRQHLLEDGGLLILDGLDEVPEARHQRERVKQAVVGFRRDFPKVRILLTSRTYAYQRQQWRLPDFEEAVLAPFDEERIEAFVERWYQHVAQVRHNITSQEAQGRALLLKEAIKRNPHLRDLAPRPLLLTLMASLHAWRGGSLPEDREQLYDESVELLLDIWERPKLMLDEEGKPVLQEASAAEWLRCPQGEIKKALEKLAYDAHRTQEDPQGAADIKEGELVAALMSAVKDPDVRHARVIEYIRDRAGLLSNKGDGVYSFPHRTFQEYMAARYLTESGFPDLLVKLVKQDPERWREVLLLAGAKVARGTPYAAWSLADYLCPQTCGDELAKSATDNEWWAALLAGQLLVDTGIYQQANGDSPDAHKLVRVRSWLTVLVSGGHLPPADRAMAGRALGLIGDTRPGVGVVDDIPDIGWCEVEAGPFTMGSDKKADRLADGEEQPPFTCNAITEPYRISRYPVTNAQYQKFIEVGGYQMEQYWPEAGWAWRQSQKIEGPREYGPLFLTPNHPRIGVSWYEAVAYCSWLSERLGYTVRLPSEAEWERVARHTDGRVFPWGDEFDARRFNMSDTGIGATSTVGIFPDGDSICGAADMSGNVWEWCSTKWQGDYQGYEDQVDETLNGDDRRVLRGGAFRNDLYLVRCAVRVRYVPNGRSNFNGFRVCAPGL